MKISIILLIIFLPIKMLAQDYTVKEVKNFHQIDKNNKNYGRVLASSDNCIVISTSAIASSDDFCVNGSVYIYERKLDDEWMLDTILTNRVRGMFAASLALQGKYLVVGAPAENDQLGAVYIFRKSETKWKLFHKLTMDNHEQVKKFGLYVNMRDNNVVVGCGSHSKVFLYKLEENGIRQIGNIENPSAKQFTSFGSTIDISKNYLFIGDYFGDSESHRSSGVVYVYENILDSIRLVEKIYSPSPKKSGHFGKKIAASYSNLAISAEDGNGVSGNVYMFNLLDKKWQFQEKISNSLSQHSDCFGLRLALDKDLLVISATNYNNEFEDQGAVFVYRKDKTKWNQIGIIYSSDHFPYNRLGWSLALHEREIVAGTFKNSLTVKNNDEPQKVYLFEIDQ